MASKAWNRRASVQLNVRLEPADAAFIKRIIPKGSLSAVTAAVLLDYARKLEAQMPQLGQGGDAAA